MRFKPSGPVCEFDGPPEKRPSVTAVPRQAGARDSRPGPQLKRLLVNSCTTRVGDAWNHMRYLRPETSRHSLSQDVMTQLSWIGEVGNLPTVEVIFGHAVFGKTLESVGVS